MENRPNILLLMADQMRADCLGIAGNPDVKTPFLDSLAAEGVLYPNAYSACPTCVPARASLYTGMSQKKTGRVGYEDLVPWEYPHTLAGELSKELYFDLKADPHESHNAIEDKGNAARVEELRNFLIQELAGREEGYSDGHRLIVGRPPVTVLSRRKERVK